VTLNDDTQEKNMRNTCCPTTKFFQNALSTIIKQQEKMS